MKALLRRFLLGGDLLPQWVPLGLEAPQQVATMWLEGIGPAREITHAATVAALRPFTLAVAVDAPSGTRATIRVRERGDSGRPLGKIDVISTRVLEPGRITLFETLGFTNAALPGFQPAAHRFFQARHRKRGQDPYNFEMAPRELEALFVFYFCPRPVVLVSVVDGARGNMFPMDLIGPAGGGRFLMALRNTSPAVALIRSSRRLARSAVPFETAAAAYELGKHHRLETIDWKSLSFAVRPSRHYGLPVMANALSVEEARVIDVHDVGSHILFVTELAGAEQLRGGPQLFHAPGTLVERLRRSGRGIPGPTAG